MPKDVATYLFIDCQILQTSAYDRGMGKYTTSLLKHLSLHGLGSEYLQVFLVLNTNLDMDEARQRRLKNIFPSATMLKVDLPTDIAEQTIEKYKTAGEILAAEIRPLTKGAAADYLVTAPFFIDFPATFPSLASVRKLSLVYDFIPYKIWHLQKIFPDEVYFRYFQLLLEADHLFTISESVRDDMITMFGFDSYRITSINGAAFQDSDDHIRKTANNLKKPYILSVSAPIVHKNNENAIKGFQRFNQEHGNKYRLIVTSTFDEVSKIELSKLSPCVEFTGNVTDAQMADYYENAEALLFASLAEGLGLPVLEAVQHDLPVACSRIPVLEEVSTEAFYMFDPLDPLNIAEALGAAVSRAGWGERSKLYGLIEQRYTWDHVADALVMSLAAHVQGRGTEQRHKLLVVAPRPDGDSARSRFLEQFYAPLSAVYDVSCMFTGRNFVANPSYVEYIGRAYGGEESLDVMLILAESARWRRFAALNRIPALELSIRRRNLPRMLRHKFGLAGRHGIHIESSKAVFDGGLGVYGWTYVYQGRSLTSSKLLGLLDNCERAARK